MRGQIKTGWIILLGVILIGFYCGMTYNRLVRLHEEIPHAWGQVENVLQRWNDLIPNLVEVVKGYAKHEQTVLHDVTEALKAFNRASTVSDKIAADNQITSLLG